MYKTAKRKKKPAQKLSTMQNKQALYGDGGGTKPKSLVSLQEWLDALMVAKLWDN